MQKVKKAFLIFIFLLIFYALLRFIFYQLYFSRNDLPWIVVGKIAYWGFRMDITAIFYSNIIFFLYYFLLSGVLFVRHQKFTDILLLTVLNVPLLAINMIDLVYYRFNLRRSTVDFFTVAPDALPALGIFWKTWWPFFLLFVVLLVALISGFRYILGKISASRNRYLQTNLFPCCFFLLATGLIARGFTERPIIPSTPLLYLPAQYQPLAGNSTMTVLYSMLKRQTRLKEKKYFPESALDTLFTAKHQFHPAAPFNKMNIVIFILESFAKEYIDKKDSLQAQTPFLDSVMKESIVCNNAYANGLESNKGIVAILASIPPFFDEPFYYSLYSNNNIRGIGTLLTEEGYQTSFFMGAGYDHFGFARFSRMMGIDHYYSMKDYGNNNHYDGNWGIYDHYFLPYAAGQLAKTTTPFFSTLFTISTHFPYSLPDTLKKKFTIPGQGVEQNSMSYLDYSLRLFFETIKNETWYKNTLFVFSADHNIFWHTREKATLYKRFRIPIFFHLPGQRVHKNIDKTVEQVDLVPSILDLLHYKKPFMSFGSSVFDSASPGIAISRFEGLYQAIDSSYLFGYNEKTEQPAYLYNFRQDPALLNNLSNTAIPLDLHGIKITNRLKAVIQRFNNSMIKNNLYIKQGL